MEEKTGIHFKPANVGSVEAHNERSQEYLDGVKRSGREFYFFPDLTHLNKSVVNPKYENMTCKEIFEKQQELYIQKFKQKPNLKDRVVKNKKTGKERVISGWSPIREGVAPIKEDTKLEDFAPFIKWCEDNGLSIIRIDLHFDEGYETIKGLRSFNRHAHIVVDWLDWETGKTIKLDEAKMSEAQDIIAASLGMERGEKKAETGKTHLSPSEYREKVAEEKAAELEEENQALKEENRKLKEENTGLMAKIQDTWVYKGQAQELKRTLESERASHSQDIAELNQRIAELMKELEDEKLASARIRKSLLSKIDEQKNEIDSLKSTIGKKNRQIQELTRGKETSQDMNLTKGFKR